jgi:hypothetical protein
MEIMSDDKETMRKDEIRSDDWKPSLSPEELHAKYGPPVSIETVTEVSDDFWQNEAAGLALCCTRRFPRTNFIWRAAYKAALHCLTKESGDPIEATARAARAAYMNRKRYKAVPSKTQKHRMRLTVG